jgi:hypothetical protein
VVVEERVRVELERSGGFAGRTIRRGLDTADLPSDAADQLRSLARAAEAMAGGPAGGPGRGADRFTYRLQVTRGAHETTLDVAEPVPESLRPLIALLSTAPLLPAHRD